MEGLANKKNYINIICGEKGQSKMCLDVYTNGERGPETSFSFVHTS